MYIFMQATLAHTESKQLLNNVKRVSRATKIESGTSLDSTKKHFDLLSIFTAGNAQNSLQSTD